jgi:hypothetical protein
LRGEWGRGKPPFPLIKSEVGMSGEVYQSFGGLQEVFLFFHEILSKGGHPSSKEMVNVGCGLSKGGRLSSKEMVNVGCGLSKGGLSKLEIIFPT